MPIGDKVAAANHINDLMKRLVAAGGFELKWRIIVDPEFPEDAPEKPQILVELGGPDSPSVLAQNAELLRSFEYVALKSLRLEHEEHDLMIFDCRGYRAGRQEELKQAADQAAERVRKTGA